jgi:hypothetical protein
MMTIIQVFNCQELTHIHIVFMLLAPISRHPTSKSYTNAEMPVTSRPTISDWMVSVPS